MLNLTFVCLGNVFRSVYAEKQFKKMLSERNVRDISVHSTGFVRLQYGEPEHLNILENSDLVLVMEDGLKDLVKRFNDTVEIYTLKEYVDSDAEDVDIGDPMGGNEAFEEEIDACLNRLLEKLIQDGCVVVRVEEVGESSGRNDQDHKFSNALEDLLDVSIALSSARDLETLLALILSEARRFATADAGTLYLVEGDSLQAKIAQCQTFVDRWGEEEASHLFSSFTIPIRMNSIAGAAALTREVVNIADVQDPASVAPFQYNPEQDRKNGYSTHSNLAVPMLDRDGVVIGVLQLINAQDAGRVCPFGSEYVKLAQALASQAAVAIKNTQLTESLLQANLDTLYRLGVAAEWRDKETANHIARVSHYSATIARHLGWSEEDVELVLHASPMHDVGKLGIPDAILQKPGRLDEEEYRIMQTHAIIGANIMKKADNPVMQMAQIMALNHHEKWDGTGYPRGLVGEDIPQVARIVALADVYDALSSRRCYKPAFSEEKVTRILKEETGKHFDPETVAAFWDKLDTIREIHHRYADSDEDLEKFHNYDTLVLEEE